MLGVYDSGVGGLTVVKELRKLMPETSITYFGDTARAPYGGKDAQTLFAHGREIIQFLLDKGATTIVMACGTSSSVSLESLREEFPGVPIVDTIRPAVQATAELSRKMQDFKPVFIATAATVKSGVFEKLYRECASDSHELIVRACPLFAPMVEHGLEKTHPLLNFVAQHYLADLRGKINALVLGCTHYPLLTDAISSALGEITFINPAAATALAAKEMMPATKSKSPPKLRFFSSGDPKKFSQTAKFILDEKVRARMASF